MVCIEEYERVPLRCPDCNGLSFRIEMLTSRDGTPWGFETKCCGCLARGGLETEVETVVTRKWQPYARVPNVVLTPYTVTIPGPVTVGGVVKADGGAAV